MDKLKDNITDAMAKLQSALVSINAAKVRDPYCYEHLSKARAYAQQAVVFIERGITRHIQCDLESATRLVSRRSQKKGGD